MDEINNLISVLTFGNFKRVQYELKKSYITNKNHQKIFY